jgi:hypothetical protein
MCWRWRVPPDDEPDDEKSFGGSATSAVAIAERPPKVRLHSKAEVDWYARRADAIAIRHSSNHKVVAMIEIVSPGNKSGRHALTKFVEKVVEFLEAGIHLLVIDLFPPGTFDPRGFTPPSRKTTPVNSSPCRLWRENHAEFKWIWALTKKPS